MIDSFLNNANHQKFMFGTSGIRGIYGELITETFVSKIASIFSEIEDSSIVVGRDVRESGKSLEYAISTSLLSSKKSLFSLSIVPTPLVSFATTLDYLPNIGIMITASHNPDEYNGLKLIKNGKELSRQDELKIEEAFSSPSSQLNSTNSTTTSKDYQKTSVSGIYDFSNIVLRDYFSLISKNVKIEEMKEELPKLSIMVDSNGAASPLTSRILSYLGCDVVSLNDLKYGFSRPSEPTEKNLYYLKSLSNSLNSDITIAHDGDGDRCVIFRQGKQIPYDVQLAMMIEYHLSNSSNKTITTTYESSLVVIDSIIENGGKPHLTPVGSRYVAEEMEKIGSSFGGEPCGEYVFNTGIGVPDGVMTALKFVEMFSLNGKDYFDSLLEKYSNRKYHIIRKKYISPKKYDAVRDIASELGFSNIHDEEGLRISEDEGWFLVRASGTEPLVRITIEYKSKEKLDKKIKELEGIILSHIK